MLALAIADELGLDEDQRRLVEFAAMLQDIGKIETPREILHKPGPLSAEEWEQMRVHTIAGQRMLDRVGGTLHDVGLVVRSARERYAGDGYPDALAGQQIPLAARVVAVAAAYSAMTAAPPLPPAADAGGGDRRAARRRRHAVRPAGRRGGLRRARARPAGAARRRRRRVLSGLIGFSIQSLQSARKMAPDEPRARRGARTSSEN